MVFKYLDLSILRRNWHWSVGVLAGLGVATIYLSSAIRKEKSKKRTLEL